MRQSKGAEFGVGLFVLGVLFALLFAAFKISRVGSVQVSDPIKVFADFDNVGSLSKRAPVRVGGVRIGQVSAIHLDAKTYRARVTLTISNSIPLPVDSTASIYTEGLLGANYIDVSPGFAKRYLEADNHIIRTNSAVVLEKLIGKVLFHLSSEL